MRNLLHEHNILNGFSFVLFEFILVALVAIFVGAAEFSKGELLWAIGFIGIAVNAAAICATVVGQIRRGDQSKSLTEAFSGKGREAIQRDHPDLGRHTIQIVGATLIPFLLTVLIIFDK